LHDDATLAGLAWAEKVLEGDEDALRALRAAKAEAQAHIMLGWLAARSAAPRGWRDGSCQRPRRRRQDTRGRPAGLPTDSQSPSMGIMRVCVLLAAMFIAGCGSSSPSTPAEQCTDLGTSLCTREAECAVANGIISLTQSREFTTNCEAGYELTAACSRVKQVNGHPDVCTADFRAEPCSAFDATAGLPLPDSCVALFQ
jgi:hypothetical protein